ncbi:Aste57867_12155 [Aphanomyces stellatus]|uniref:Aste57867_12155 protein n=1 Tax=Aphanomyces stellatus TaxID=120398 RepID=A0A485KV94_9STRA|nr:hypothetical protein As57867_012110 [Aphanomyces stellatus]VFT89009.1 Aste57867_12155 [Aphanomyces stellatus]
MGDSAALLRAMDATLRRVCRRLESLEEQVDALPLKVSQEMDMDAIRTAMAELTEHMKASTTSPAPTSIPSTEAPPATTSTTRQDAVGSLNAAPSQAPAPAISTWHFPVTSCRDLWLGWFIGDANPSPPVGPFRSLDPDTLSNTSAGRFHCAKAVVAWIVHAAVHLWLATSEEDMARLSRQDLLRVFDQAFPSCLKVSTHGALTRRGFQDMTMDDAVAASFPSIHARWTTADDDDGSGTRRSTSAESNTTRAMAAPSPAAATISLIDSSDDDNNAVRRPRVTPSSPTTWPTMTTRELWMRWHVADPNATPPRLPLRQSTSADATHAVAARAIQLVVDVALRRGYIQSTDELTSFVDAALARVFDRAFPRLVGAKQDGRLTHPSVQDCTYSEAKQWPFQTLVARITDKTPHVAVVAPPAKTTPSTSSSSVDGGGRPAQSPRAAAASSWSFPTTDARIMWPMWFLGDPSAPPAFAGPLRLFKHDMVPAAWKRRLSETRRVMTFVLDACLSYGLAETAESLGQASEADLLAVFDAAFPRVLGMQLDGSLTRPGFESWTYAKAITFKVTSFARRLTAARSGDDELDDAKTTPTSGDTDWTFPITTTRILWEYWFRGDPAAPPAFAGPLRLVGRRLTTARERRSFGMAQRLVSWVVETAVAHDLAASEAALATMPPPALLAVFDTAFALFLGLQEDGTLARPGWEQRSFAQIAWWKYPVVARACDPSSSSAAEDDDEIEAKRPAARAFEFPVTTCRQLWRLWFVGDDTSGRGPYRLLDHACRSPLARANFADAQRVITWLVDVAVTHGLIDGAAALATLARFELLVVFDEAFGVALDADDDGMLMRRGFEDFALDQVSQMKYTLVLRRLEMMPPSPPPPRVAPTTDSTALPSPQSSNKLFRWADGTARRAPEGWIFPQLSCRRLWCKWYFGDEGDDDHDRVGPYRHLQPSDVGDNSVMRRRLLAAQFVMEMLVGIAETQQFVSPHQEMAALDQDDSLAVFERAFDVLMFNNPNGNLAGPNAGQVRPEIAEHVAFSAVARAMAPPSARSTKRRRHADMAES